MVSDKLMKSILAVMKPEPLPIYEIMRKVGKQEGSVRPALMVMLDLGLVEKVEIHPDSQDFKTTPARIGWKKRIA
jgi:hypothetical protein